MLVNVKLDVSWQKGLPFKVGDLLVFLIFKGTAKTKLAILVLLYCEEIMKNSSQSAKKV